MVPLPAASLFRFFPNKESVQHNTNLFANYNFDLTRLIRDHQHILLVYGFKFLPINVLESIYRNHNIIFPFFAKLHQRGMEYIYKETLSDSERMAKFKANIAWGNRTSQQPQNQKNDRKNQQGCALWLCCTNQKIGTDGDTSSNGATGRSIRAFCTDTVERVLKDQLTHNLTFSITQPNTSVYKRCNVDVYPEIVYGFCLMWIINLIVVLRLHFPAKNIFLSKYNFSDAYRRILHIAKTALVMILVTGMWAYIYLWLLFGWSVNPPSLCCFLAMLMDLSNKLPLILGWDLDALHSPIQPTVPEPLCKDKSKPFMTAQNNGGRITNNSSWPRRHTHWQHHQRFHGIFWHNQETCGFSSTYGACIDVTISRRERTSTKEINYIAEPVSCQSNTKRGANSSGLINQHQKSVTKFSKI